MINSPQKSVDASAWIAAVRTFCIYKFLLNEASFINFY